MNVQPEQILVVDDEEAIREVVSTMLESRGYHCTAVSNGRAAQDFVRKQLPDLVLSDMIMPEMDGIKLLEWLRNFDPEVPVIMVTAIHDISTALEAISTTGWGERCSTAGWSSKTATTSAIWNKKCAPQRPN